MIDLSPANVTAHNQYEDDRFAVSHVVDKIDSTDAKTCSCCGTVNTGGWIQLDLGGQHVLDHMFIKSRTDSKCSKTLKNNFMQTNFKVY